MNFLRLLRRGTVLATAGTLLFGTTTMLHAAQTPTSLATPVLFAKSWLVGYTLVFLAILLGMLAVLIPSMRKALRKKDS